MEHDERDESIENLEEVLESLTTESGNFEDFLGRKAEECASDIILKLKELPIAAESSESRPSNGKPAGRCGGRLLYRNECSGRERQHRLVAKCSRCGKRA
jgi:hypothetical protein